MEILFVLVALLFSILAWRSAGRAKRDVRMLSGQLQELKERIGALQQGPAEASAIEQGVVFLTEETTPIEFDAESADDDTSLPIAEIEPPVVPAKPKKAKATSSELEALIGGKLLNRIGSLALILGVGFFLKYAFDNAWFTETMRVLVGVLIGALMLITGWRTHKKGFSIFSQGLVGGGLSILYLSGYASFNYYHLLPQPFAFLAMIGVTALAFYQAFYYDSLAISLLGWLGGFLTPFMLSTGVANAPGLFGYIAILDLGLVAVVARKEKWAILESLTLCATYLVYFLWYFNSYTEADLLVAFSTVTIYWLMFTVLAIYRVAKGSRSNDAVAFANFVLYFGSAISLLDSHQYLAAVYSVGLSIVYAFLSAYTKKKTGESALVQWQSGAAVLLLTVGSWYAFDNYWIPVTWSVEAAFILWYGIKSSDRTLVTAATMLHLASIIELLLLLDQTGAYYPILTLRSLGFVTSILALALSAYYAHRAEQAQTFTIGIVPNRAATSLSALYDYAWSLLFLTFLGIELSELGDYYLEVLKVQTFAWLPLMVVAIGWALASLLFRIISLTMRSRALIVVSIFGFGTSAVLVAALGAQLSAPASFTLLLNMHGAATIAVALCALMAASLKERKGETEPAANWSKLNAILQSVAYYCFAWVLILGINTEIQSYYDSLNGRAVENAGVLYHASIVPGIAFSILALCYSYFGFRYRITPLIHSALAALALAMVMIPLKGFSYAPAEQFIPILNVRALGELMLLLSCAGLIRLSQLYPDAWKPAVKVRGILLLAITLVILLGLTSEVRDIFERQIAIHPTTSIQLENDKQLALSSTWLIYSILLMVLGIWRRSQSMRIIAIALFGITILKIFIYDLSFLESLYRIFSFIGLGLILLTVSYLYQRYKSLIFDTRQPELAPETVEPAVE